MNLLSYVLIFLSVFPTLLKSQENISPISENRIPSNIFTDLNRLYGINYTNYLNEDYRDYKFYQIENKYLLWFSYWSTASNYTALVFTDVERILSFKEYFDRTPYSLNVWAHNYLQINYDYGCCDGRYRTATFYNIKPDELKELTSVVLEVDKRFSHENDDKYKFTLHSKHELIVEENKNYSRITIQSDYSVTKLTWEEYLNHQQNIKEPIKFSVKLIFNDYLFYLVETENELLKKLMECFYGNEKKFDYDCYEIYGQDRFATHWGDEKIWPVKPYLIFIDQLPFSR